LAAIIAFVQASAAPDTRANEQRSELAQRLAAFFLYVANASNREFLPQASELELSLTQLKTLAVLQGRAEELSVKEVAEGLGLSVGATSRAVDGLCKRGLVDRSEDLADRRVRRVRLTARGMRTMEKLTAVRIAAVERLLDSLSATQREDLERALEPIVGREEVRRFIRPRRRSP
jgi:DNA-binding MarR family transcriptional regulator